MSQIRRQSIISTIIIFIGFSIGLLNNLFFTNAKWFTEAQYGLTSSYLNFSQLIFVFAYFGLTSVIYKFTPYYKAHLKEKDNDLLSITLLTATISFFIICILGYFLKDLFLKKFIAKSPELVTHYFWLFPFAYFLLVFTFLESYLWSLHKSVVSNFFREVILRLYNFVLIILFILKIISYESLLKLFVLSYAILSIGIFIYLKIKNQLFFTLKISIVTKKFLKKMIPFTLFIYAGTVIITIAQLTDSLIISTKLGQTFMGIFSITTFASNLIQVPQRSVIAVTIPILANAWRQKDYSIISKIYKRSSINLLLISLLIFGILWLSYADGIKVLHMKETYLQGKYLFLLLGIKLIIDMGTGVNGQIIATSNFWKFEFLTGLILLILIMPLSYILVDNMGLLGIGISSLISYTIYNTIRIIFLWKKYKMQPFSFKTLYSISIALIIYAITYFCFQNLSGWLAIFLRTTLLILLFGIASFYLKLSPDIEPVLNTLKKKLKIIK